MIFWGYLAGILLTILVLFIASKNVLASMVTSGDPLNQAIAAGVTVTLILIPLFLISAYFYEKVLEREGDVIRVRHRIFFLPIWTRAYKLAEGLKVEHSMDSPNMAKMSTDPNLRAFQNQGHFELYAYTEKGKVFLDRHSRRSDLEKLASILAPSF